MSENARSDTKSLRILAAIRQSKHRKGQTPDTSPELQREHIDAWATGKGHTVIGESLDLNISGSKVAPWNRPDLGAWLRDKSDLFDAIVVDNLDRAGRDVEAFLGFRSRYLAPLGKSLHIASLDIDLSTPEGETVAINIMAVAQLMAKQHAVKMRDVNASVRAKGQHAGGDVPFGYRAAKLATPGFGYAIDPLDAWIVRKMAARYLAGSSLRAVAMWLNDKCGIPSPRGGQWSRETVRHILTSPAIAGIATKSELAERERKATKEERAEGKPDKIKVMVRVFEPLLDASGQMVTFTEGIVTVAEWNRLRDIRNANGHRGPRSNGSNLLHVAWCGHCGAPLYSAPQTQRGHTYRYLKCARKVKVELPGECVNPVIRAELVEQAISETILAELGGVPMRVRHVTPADDKARELEFVETQLAGLADALISGKMSPELAGKAETGLMARRETLIREARPEVVEWRDAGTTFGEHWQSLDAAGRHAFMVQNKIRASVHLPGAGPNQEVLAEYDRKPLPDSLWFPVIGRDIPGGADTARMTLRAGRHAVFVWLGDLESMRERAAKAV